MSYHYISQTEAYRDLAAAIVRQAADDYLYLMNKGLECYHGISKPEIETFFKSEWFNILCPKYDGMAFLEILNRDHKEVTQAENEYKRRMALNNKEV